MPPPRNLDTLCENLHAEALNDQKDHPLIRSGLGKLIRKVAAIMTEPRVRASEWNQMTRTKHTA